MQVSLDVEIPKTGILAGQGSELVAKELEAAIEWGVMKAQQAIVPRAPINNGQLRQGWQTQIFGSPAGDQIMGTLYNPMAHALPMETGTRPFWPPLAPLEQWAKRKFSVDGAQARSIAFLVARKISREGIKGRHFFADGWASVKGQVEQRMQMALARIRDGLAGGGGAA